MTAHRYGKDVMHAIDTIVDGTPLLLQPAVQALVSAWCTLLGLCAQVYLLQGRSACIVALVPLVSVFMLSTVFGLGTLFFAERRIDQDATIASFESFEMLFDTWKGELDNVRAFFEAKRAEGASAHQMSRFLEFSFETSDLMTLRCTMLDAKAAIVNCPRMRKLMDGPYADVADALTQAACKHTEEAMLINLLRGDLAMSLLGGVNSKASKMLNA